MGYRGKVAERERARELRAAGWTVPDIQVELGVSRSSVSLWTRDIEVETAPRRVALPRPNRLRDQRLAEIADMDQWGSDRLGALCEQAFLAAGAALYAGEGSKTDGMVSFANSDARIVGLFVSWLRSFFDIQEHRLRARLYLHEGLDLERATANWVQVTGIPREQFGKPYRAVPDVGIRSNKHEFGCVTVRYSCARTHRAVMGLIRALLCSSTYSGVAQSVEQGTVNAKVESSSLSPGAKGP